MVSHIEQLVIKQLTVDEDGVYFIPDQYALFQMFQEQLLWEQEQNKGLDLSTVSGGNYESLMSLFQSGMNMARTTSDNLREKNKQIIVLGIWGVDEEWDREYLFNLSDNQLILTVYSKSEMKLRRMYIVSVDEFECKYLTLSIRSKTPEEIIQLLKPTLLVIESYLIVQMGQNEDGLRKVVTNF